MKDKGEMSVVQDVEPKPFTFSDEVTQAYARQVYLSSVDTQRQVAGNMVTVATGFFAVYLAIMKFLGIDSIIGAGGSPANIALFVLPPVFLIASVICFAWSTLPLRKELGLEDLTAIRDARRSMIRTRWWASIAGWGCFTIALVLTIVVATLALGVPG